MTKLILPIAFIFIFVACTENKNDEQLDPTVQSENSDINPTVGDNAAAYSEQDDLILVIDEQCKESPYVQSMMYSREDQSMLDAIAFLDENNSIIKIEEKALEGNEQRISNKTFYFNGGSMFATRETSEKEGKNGFYFEEILTFYDQDEKPSSSKVRTATFEEYLEEATYLTHETKAISPERTMEVINQEGDFETTYQGYVDGNGARFLIVGQDQEDGFTSSLMIQPTKVPDPTLTYLFKQGKAALGQRLQITYERTIDERGYEFQVLTGIALLKTKSEAEAMKE